MEGRPSRYRGWMSAVGSILLLAGILFGSTGGMHNYPPPGIPEECTPVNFSEDRGADVLIEQGWIPDGDQLLPPGCEEFRR